MKPRILRRRIDVKGYDPSKRPIFHSTLYITLLTIPSDPERNGYHQHRFSRFAAKISRNYDNMYLEYMATLTMFIKLGTINTGYKINRNTKAVIKQPT
jgi:hypothetical protein